MTHKQILLSSCSRGDSALLFPAHCHQISSLAPSRYKAMRRSTEAKIELLAGFRLHRENGIGKEACQNPKQPIGTTLSCSWSGNWSELIAYNEVSVFTMYSLLCTGMINAISSSRTRARLRQRCWRGHRGPYRPAGGWCLDLVKQFVLHRITIEVFLPLFRAAERFTRKSRYRCRSPRPLAKILCLLV